MYRNDKVKFGLIMFSGLTASLLLGIALLSVVLQRQRQPWYPSRDELEHFGRGIEFANNGQNVKAIEELSAAIKCLDASQSNLKSPERAKYHLHRAICCNNINEYRHAVEDATLSLFYIQILENNSHVGVRELEKTSRLVLANALYSCQESGLASKEIAWILKNDPSNVGAQTLLDKIENETKEEGQNEIIGSEQGLR